MPVIIAESIAFILFTIGLYFLLAAAFRLPPNRIIKNVSYLSRLSMSSGSSLNGLLRGVTDRIAKHLTLSEDRQDELQNQLEALEIGMTPEQYVASSVTKGCMLLPLIIPAALIHPVFIIFVILAVVLVSYFDMRRIQKVFILRKREIDTELPRFVAVVEQTFRHDKNVLTMLETYIKTDETALTKELKIVVADMQTTGNGEIALTRFEKRINSIYLSETVRGLISTTRGENTVNYFTNLNEKLSDEEDAHVKGTVMKLPSKIKMLAALNLANIALIYAVVFISVGASGLGSIFGA